MIDNIIDQIHDKYPETVSCIQEKDGTIFFFDKYGLTKLSLKIKQIIQQPFGSPQIVVDLFEYEKKLIQGK